METSVLTTLLEFACKLNPDLLQTLLLAMLATPFGVVVLVLIFWRLNERKQGEMIQMYRDDMVKVLAQHGADITKISNYYDSNVELVKSWERIANGFQDQVILNTQTMQRMVDVCLTNQFCPNARVSKPSMGPK